MLCVHFQISHFKIPRYIKFTDEFPLTVTGKVNALMVYPDILCDELKKKTVTLFCSSKVAIV